MDAVKALAAYIRDQRRILGSGYERYAKRCFEHWREHYGEDVVKRVEVELKKEA